MRSHWITANAARQLFYIPRVTTISATALSLPTGQSVALIRCTRVHQQQKRGNRGEPRLPRCSFLDDPRYDRIALITSPCTSSRGWFRWL
jgi:hypothetical protein